MASFDVSLVLSLLTPDNIHHINPFQVTGLFLHFMEISENLWFSDVFTGYRKRPVV